MPPLNVLILHAPTGVGGAEGVILNQNRFVDPERVRLWNCPFINFGRGESDYLRALQERGIAYDAIPLVRRFEYRYVRETRRLMRLRGIDLIHTHGYRADVTALLAAGGRTPVVSTVHGFTGSSTRVRLYERLQRQLLGRMAALIAVSEPIAATLVQRGVPPVKVRRLSNVVDVEALERTAPVDVYEETAEAPVGLRILFVGRLSPEKGLDVLLDACRILGEKDVPFALRVVGDGRLRETYARQVEASGLGGCVRFLGFRADATGIMRSADVFVMPSRSEGIPLVALEAMCLGVPLVATRVGGLPEIVRPEETGILVDPEDPEALSDALRRVSEHREDGERMGRAAAAYVRSRFDPHRWARTIEDIYCEVAGREPPGR